MPYTCKINMDLLGGDYFNKQLMGSVQVDTEILPK